VPGEITEIVSEIDPRSRTRKVKVLAGVEGDMLPGTFGRLWLEDEARPTVWVPARRDHAGRPAGEVCRWCRTTAMFQRLVRSGPPARDQVEILSGLNAAKQVLAGAPARE
jgi:multidrug efflux pump subunit AcrA (membrane-fusion protein)